MTKEEKLNLISDLIRREQQTPTPNKRTLAWLKAQFKKASK